MEDGGSIVVEVDEPAPEGGVVRAARPGEIAAKAGQTFEAALERIKPATGTIIAKLRGLSDPPDEAVVEFGLKMERPSRFGGRRLCRRRGPLQSDVDLEAGGEERG